MNTEVIILGSGNSTGIPRIDGYWGKCNKKNKKNNRTRCSAIILKGKKKWVQKGALGQKETLNL